MVGRFVACPTLLHDSRHPAPIIRCMGAQTCCVRYNLLVMTIISRVTTAPCVCTPARPVRKRGFRTPNSATRTILLGKDILASVGYRNVMRHAPTRPAYALPTCHAAVGWTASAPRDADFQPAWRYHRHRQQVLAVAASAQARTWYEQISTRG